MKQLQLTRPRLSSPLWAALALLPGPWLAHAQYFQYTSHGDLLAGFRKPAAGNYELVVNVGNATNFLALPPGSTLPITAYSPAQLSDSFNSLSGLQWSVSATVIGAPGSTWNGFARSTIWYTLPRPASDVPTSAPARLSSHNQASISSLIDSIGNNAFLISSEAGATNADNNSALVQEPAGGTRSLSTFIGDLLDPNVGDFYGEMPTSVENTTPSDFTAAVVSDLYQSVPSGYADPDGGTTSGAAYYVGSFTLNPDGTMSFTRASSTSPATPPAPSITSVIRSGDTSTIYFTTASGSFTYTLYYTNSAGVSAPLSQWAASPATLIGDGSTDHLSDTTTDTDRFYRIGVQ
jgi:hypothetical protein